MLTQEIVRDLFNYSDGNLIRKTKTAQKTKIGEVAGGHHGDGYYKLRVCGKKYFLHRIIFLWHHGFMPECLDHIDGNQSNNRIENLRAATMSQNCMNKKLQKNNTTGVRGVHLDKKCGRFVASITVLRKRVVLGYFENLEDASNCYSEKVRQFHGEFSRPIDMSVTK